jgi:hypothetical protein
LLSFGHGGSLDFAGVASSIAWDAIFGTLSPRLETCVCVAWV